MKKVIFILVVLLIQTSVFSQESRPKIGLALSGGGARGMAHVGVLKTLEELGLKPDYITGVSMGSIVGGLYAAGYSADSIEKIFLQQNWQALLYDKISEKEIVFDEKEVFRNQLFSLIFKNKKVIIPQGLIEGQSISSMMNYYTFPVATIHEFDSLSTSYHAVATDLISCKAKEFKSGDLSETMRASMAVPLVFAPVDIDSFLLVDGGVTRNFAVEELKKMGADIIIGSYTGRSMLTGDELNSAGNIIAQIVSFNGLYDAQAQKKLTDVLIEPKFKNISPVDFQKVDTIIKLGYNAAQKKVDTLKKIIEKYNIEKHSSRPLTQKSIKIDTIVYQGNEIISDRQIKNHLTIKSGKSVTQDILRKQMLRLYGLYLFKKISYRIDKKDNKNILTIKSIEKDKHRVYSSLHYDNYLNFGINLSYLGRNLLINKSRLLFQTYISKFFRVKTNYTIYFGKRDMFNVKIGANISKDNIPAMFLKKHVTQFDNYELDAYIALNLRIGNNHNIGISENIEKFSFRSPIKLEDSIRRVDFQNWCEKLSYNFINLDNFFFPKKGVEITYNLNRITPIKAKIDYNDTKISEDSLYDFNRNRYYQIFFRSRYYFTFKNITFGAKFNIAITSAKNEMVNNYSLLGGVDILNKRSFTFWGFHANEFIVQDLIGTGVSVRYNFKFGLFTGLHLDSYITDFESISNANVLLGTGVSIGYNSQIGPIKIGIMNGISEKKVFFNNWKFYMSVGFVI